jgi:hypothetical protein
MDSRDLDLQLEPFTTDAVGNRIQRLRSARYTNLARVIFGTPDDRWFVWWEVGDKRIENIQRAIAYARKPKRIQRGDKGEVQVRDVHRPRR